MFVYVYMGYWLVVAILNHTCHIYKYIIIPTNEMLS